MSNQYERSAIAESDKGIGVLVADNAAEQQDSLPAEMSPLQLLYSVVEHNVANPDKRIKLSPEQGKEIMRDFVDFVVGSSDIPTNEDGQPKTFSEMDDNELSKCLSDYLGSGVANTSINGASIELAQQLLAEMYMSEDELEDLADPKTANGRAAKEKKALERMRDAAEEEAAQSKWEKDVWSNQTYNVGSLKLTGKQIDNILDALSNPQKRAQLAEDYKNKFGGTTAEADKVLTDTEKYLKAKKRYEYLKATNQLDKMTPEEKANLELIKTNPKIEQAVAFIEEKNNKGLEIRGFQNTAEITADKIAVATDDQRKSFFGMSISAANQYELEASGIKSDRNPSGEFNLLGNPETAKAMLEAQKIAPQTQLASVSQKVMVADAGIV